jgi:hypothetical protein
LGLVNGTTNTIKDIIWKEGTDIKKDPPQSLFITVDNYNRPTLFIYKNSKNIFPIFPIFYKWEGTRGTCLQYQFIITLVFTITIHKSQGLMLK